MSNERNIWYDNLRAIATVAVVGIHVSSDYAPASGRIPMSDFWVGNVFDSLSRFAVPVFVMLSGALLLPKEYPIGTFLKKRLMRVIIPFVFWSLIYIVRSLYENVQDGVHYTLAGIARQAFVMFRDGSSIHLWYVYMIIGLYLFLPILGTWVRHSNGKEQLYFLSVWLIVLLLNQPYAEKIKPAIDFGCFAGFTGYLVLGYYLSAKTVRSETYMRWLGGVLLAAGVSVTILGTFLDRQITGRYVSDFYEPLSLNILLYAAGMFLLVRNTGQGSGCIASVRDFISRYSYGIFLSHVLFLSPLDDFGINWHFITPVVEYLLPCCVAWGYHLRRFLSSASCPVENILRVDSLMFIIICKFFI